MTHLQKNLLLRLTLLTLVLGGTALLVVRSSWNRWYLPAFPLLLGLFYLAYLLFSLPLVGALDDNKTFVRRFILLSGIKLILLLVILTVWLAVFHPPAIPFLVNILLLYFAYSLFSYLFILTRKKGKG